jgi:hypothetical protein
MRIKSFVFLLILSLMVSACGSLPLGPVTENDIPPTPAPKTNYALLIWESPDLPCQTLAVTPVGLSYGPCNESLIKVPEQLTNHSARFLELADIFSSFAAETPAGSLIFKGSGNLIPSDAEKRAIGEWGSLLFQTAQAGRSDESLGRAFSWQREGGPGAFCDNVIVYLTGLVTATDCKGYDVQGYLTASQLNQVYAWVDRLTSVDHTQTFPAATGGLELSLALNGNGQTQADEQTIVDISEFAATLFTELGYRAEASIEANEARQVLQEYLTALHIGDYTHAAQLYSGDTSLLQTWNPDLGADLPALFQRGCTQNGLQCLLPRVITHRAAETDGYHFYVEFNNADQTLFQQGPCCGETDRTSVSMFSFYVEKSGDSLLVSDLPPYVP